MKDLIEETGLGAKTQQVCGGQTPMLPATRRTLRSARDKILGYTFNQAGKCKEERMQNANKAWWRDAKIWRSKRAVEGAV